MFPVLVVPIAEVSLTEPGDNAAVPVTVPAIAFTTNPLELTTLIWSVAREVIPLVYFASLSKFTVSAAGCVTVNERISDNVMFKLAVWANDAELIKVTNAINANNFFIVYIIFLQVFIWIDLGKRESKMKKGLHELKGQFLWGTREMGVGWNSPVGERGSQKVSVESGQPVTFQAPLSTHMVRRKDIRDS